MFFDRPRNRIIAALSLMALAVHVFGGGEALAQKGGGTPPPPSPAPGTIYFSGWVATSGSGYYAPMTMNGDGTNKQNAFSTSVPSYGRHSNSRWFLVEDYDWDGPLDQWGIPMAWEVYAVNERNQRMKLTGNATVHVSELGSPAWGKNDSFVSYPGWWFTGPNPWDVKGGLFVVDIDWSTGVPVAGAPRFLFGAEAYWFQNWDANVNIDEHDWSPSGNAVAFYKEVDSTSAAGTYVADFASGTAQIRALTTGSGAQWSPDGSRIAFSVGEIWTIKPDGTNAVRITQHTVTKSTERSQVGPSWSPDGAFIAYTEAVASGGKTSRSIIRIPSGGGSAVNLTTGLVQAGGAKWRP